LPSVDALSFAPDPAHLPPINAAGIYLPGGAGRLSAPRSLVFQNCTNVRVSGLHLKNQAKWGFVFIYCNHVVAENLGVHIDSYIPSSDGMDVCSCDDVKISGCDIACTDDDISIKAGKDADGLRVNRPSQNITISDCNFGTGGGVAMGSEVSGSIRHVLVQRCKFTGSGTVARIKSQPSRGGVVEDIVYRDITVEKVARAIEMDLQWRMVPPIAPRAKELTVLRNVRIINLTGTAQSVGLIRGYKDVPIQDVVFDHCQVSAERGLAVANAPGLNTSGLDIKVASGEPVIHESDTAQP
jgi:polygalacturonase